MCMIILGIGNFVCFGSDVCYLFVEVWNVEVGVFDNFNFFDI